MTSVISLSSLAILMGAICDACVECMCIPRKRRICPATTEETDLRLIVRPNAEVLSQKR